MAGPGGGGHQRRRRAGGRRGSLGRLRVGDQSRRDRTFRMAPAAHTRQRASKPRRRRRRRQRRPRDRRGLDQERQPVVPARAHRRHPRRMAQAGRFQRHRVRGGLLQRERRPRRHRRRREPRAGRPERHPLRECVQARRDGRARQLEVRPGRRAEQGLGAGRLPLLGGRRPAGVRELHGGHAAARASAQFREQLADHRRRGRRRHTRDHHRRQPVRLPGRSVRQPVRLAVRAASGSHPMGRRGLRLDQPACSGRVLSSPLRGLQPHRNRRTQPGGGRPRRRRQEGDPVRILRRPPARVLARPNRARLVAVPCREVR